MLRTPIFVYVIGAYGRACYESHPGALQELRAANRSGSCDYGIRIQQVLPPGLRPREVHALRHALKNSAQVRNSVIAYYLHKAYIFTNKLLKTLAKLIFFFEKLPIYSYICAYYEQLAESQI